MMNIGAVATVFYAVGASQQRLAYQEEVCVARAKSAFDVLGVRSSSKDWRMEKLKKGRLLLVSNFGTVIIRDDDLRISAIGHDQYMRERMNAPAGTPPPKWKTNEEWYREAERIASKIWPGYRLVRIKVGNIGDDYVPELRSGSNVRNTVYVQFWAKTNRVTRALGMSFDRGSGRFYEGLLQDPPPTSSPTRKPLPPRKDN